MNRHVVEIWIQRASDAENKGDEARMIYCLQQAEKAEQIYDKIQERKDTQYGRN